MPIGPYGEIIGTTNCLDGVSEAALKSYKSRVNVPKNPKVVSDDDPKHKLTPSVYMFQMSMDTEKKLANTRDMRRPQKVELLDMSETTHQKVCIDVTRYPVPLIDYLSILKYCMVYLNQDPTVPFVLWHLSGPTAMDVVSCCTHVLCNVTSVQLGNILKLQG